MSYHLCPYQIFARNILPKIRFWLSPTLWLLPPSWLSSSSARRVCKRKIPWSGLAWTIPRQEQAAPHTTTAVAIIVLPRITTREACKDILPSENILSCLPIVLIIPAAQGKFDIILEHWVVRPNTQLLPFVVGNHSNILASKSPWPSHDQTGIKSWRPFEFWFKLEQ